MSTLKDFDFIKDLGKGAFGQVCLVKKKAGGATLAMKRVKMSNLNRKERENALNEVRILASVVHKNIVSYYEAFFDENSRTLNIIMEFADDGDLSRKIKNHKARGTKFPESEIWEMIIQCTRGLKALHDNKIMHRDIKSANIFATKDKCYKIGDLNVSKVLKSSMAFTQTGTPYYASPEVWSDKPYSYKSDLWSLGCVIYELCTLRPPFTAANMEKLYKSVIKGAYDPIPSVYSKELAFVVSKMLQTNPDLRYDCEAILNDKFVAKRINYDGVVEDAKVDLKGTIKMPFNMKEINHVLPKKKKGSRTPERERPVLTDEKRERSRTPTKNEVQLTDDRRKPRIASKKEERGGVEKKSRPTTPGRREERRLTDDRGRPRTPVKEAAQRLGVRDRVYGVKAEVKRISPGRHDIMRSSPNKYKPSSNRYDILSGNRKALEKRVINKYARELNFK